MLGRFLELSVSAQPLAELFEFYRSLGFGELPTGDITTHPYAVVHDGEICIGLHDRDSNEDRLTFIRPDLKNYLRALRRHAVSVESKNLADDEFNEITFRDPDGQLIALIEAQTFSPGDWQDHGNSVCGRFLEYSRMTDSASDAGTFWQTLGFNEVARGETPHTWLRLNGHGLTIGFHETTEFPPGLSFVATNLDARLEYLQAKSLDARRSKARGGIRASATLRPPSGAPLYLFTEDTIPRP